jgi:hypothetical protein
VALCVATAAPLLVTVAMDATFIWLRLWVSPLSGRVALPVLSMIAELILMGTRHIRAAMKRISCVASILDV